MTAVAISHRSRIDAWRSTWSIQRASLQSLHALREQPDAEPTRPWVLLNVFEGSRGVPAFLPAFTDLLLSPPWFETEYPLLGVPYLFADPVGASGEQPSVSALRALMEAGFPVAYWAPPAQHIRLPSAAYLPELSSDGTWQASSQPLSPLAFECVSVVAEYPIARWELHLVGSTSEVFRGERESPTTRLTIDISDELRALGLLLGGGIRSLAIKLEGADGASLVPSEAALERRVDTLASATSYLGREIKGLPALRVPRQKGKSATRVVLLCGSHAIRQNVGELGESDVITWTATTAQWLRARQRTNRARSVYYFFDCGDGGNGRSPLDHWRLPKTHE